MKKTLGAILALSGLFATAWAGTIDVYGHLGAFGQTNIAKDSTKSNSKGDYAGLSGALGVKADFNSGISLGLGGWAAIPIYEKVKKNSNEIYKHIFVLSDLYFGYTSKVFSATLGRYDTNAMRYDWFSGHNQGLSLSVTPASFVDIWLLYSHQQAFQFQRFNRESGSQIGALWDYKGHTNYKNAKNNAHLIALGADFRVTSFLTATPYIYFVTNAITAPGLTARLNLGDKNGLYSHTTLKYTYATVANKGGDGHLLWLDEELGYAWFRAGLGFYKTIGNGVSGLTAYGDDSRFYGGVVGANYLNKAVGDYFGAKQSAFYAFLGARHEVFKFDLLYAGGGYKEISALFSVTLFKHLEFGAGYVNLAKVANQKRDFLNAFVKGIW